MSHAKVAVVALPHTTSQPNSTPPSWNMNGDTYAYGSYELRLRRLSNAALTLRRLLAVKPANRNLRLFNKSSQLYLPP